MARLTVAAVTPSYNQGRFRADDDQFDSKITAQGKNGLRITWVDSVKLSVLRDSRVSGSAVEL